MGSYRVKPLRDIPLRYDLSRPPPYLGGFRGKVEVYLPEVRGFGGRGRGQCSGTSTSTPVEPYLYES
jgi:hypothetical protein